MTQFIVEGMSCAACVSRVEKAVLQVGGVERCSVNLLTNLMNVEGTVNSESIITAVDKAGYKAFPKINSILNDSNNKPKDSKQESSSSQFFSNSHTKTLKKRLIFSLAFLVILLYFSMFHSMWNFPIPSFFEDNFLAIGMLEMLLTVVILFINKAFFVNGVKSVLHGSPNMDTLIALGSGVSFAYSVVILFAMTNTVQSQNIEQTKLLAKSLYFESASMIVTLITVGKLLESISKGKTTNALKGLINLAPKTATVLVDGKEITKKAEELEIGDIFVVRPGSAIPVDGVVIEGVSSVDESALTGEAIPVDKVEGSFVNAGTINVFGFIKCKATKVGQDTTLSKIIQLVSDASSTKPPIAKIADKVASVFVPVVLLISAITFFVWLFVGADFSFILNRAISVLVVSCPCALGLATPVAIMVGNGVAAKNGILFKNSVALENLCKTKIVVLDKTGTITQGIPVVTDIVSANGVAQTEFLKIAYSIEEKSEHPLAKAIIQKAKRDSLIPYKVSNFTALTGSGVQGTIENFTILGGSLAFIQKSVTLTSEILEKCEKLSAKGKTPLLFAKKENANAFELLGIIAVSDVVKNSSIEAIAELKKQGIKTIMLSGDNQITTNAIASVCKVDQAIGGVLPTDKAAVVQKLKENLGGKGTVTMVGDGINDSPALTTADTGIAISSGTDIAIEAADIVLMKNSLLDVVNAIKISKATLKNIKQNLFWAFFYNAALIPLAAGAYFSLGLSMNPMFGALAMSLSSFCVVTNALRLNFFKADNPKIEQNTEEKNMNELTEKTLNVEGMMCSHCEAHVKEALLKIDGVDEAIPNHAENKVIVKLSKDVEISEFENAIKLAGYVLKK